MKSQQRYLLLCLLVAVAAATLRVVEGGCKPRWLCERPAGVTEPTIIEWSVR